MSLRFGGKLAYLDRFCSSLRMSDAAVVHIALPKEELARLDEQARDQLRSRSNFAAYLIREGLRETAGAQENEESR
jgi:metal-responsive CopG/Arc/MetJ family transcriptional regulator